MSYLGTTKIGKMYLGNTEIAKAYLGNNLVYQQGSQPQPTMIPYIRGGADGSYIDTGITADNTVKVIVWARNWNPTSGFIFGSRTSAGVDSFAIGTHTNTKTGDIRIDYAQTNDTYALSQFGNLSNYHKYELYQGVLKIDDVPIASATQTSFSNSANIHIFGVNTNGTHTIMSLPADICACKIYKNDVLVRDYTAVNTPSVGLYDAVSGTLFTNAGSGSFTYGTFNPGAYTPLEYITTGNGGSYFLTPAVGTYDIPVVAKVMTTGTGKKYYDFCSGRGETDRFQIFVGDTTYSCQRLSAVLGTGTANNFATSRTSGFYRNKDIVFVKNKNKIDAYYGGAHLGNTYTSGVNSSYTTGVNICVGATYYKHTEAYGNEFEGRIYHMGFDNWNYVPAMSGNGVAGMYDTYNDVFKASESVVPFIAGPEIPSVTTYFRNKRIAIIGDSISTYDQDGYKYDSYRMYYPAGDVDTVNETWWKRLMDTENCTLDVNLAYSGSFSSNYNPDYPTFYDRTGLITDAEIIVVAIGTNDSTNSVPLGTFDYTTDPSNLDMSKFRESYIKGIRSLMTLYPSASIVCAIFSMGGDYRDSIKTIAEHYGLVVVDCGNDYEKYVTVHPNANGMIQIYRNFLYV